MKFVLCLSVLQSSEQCISRVMLVVLGAGVLGYDRCMTLLCMREHCMFLTVKNLPYWENAFLNCVGRWSMCTVT